MTKCTCPCYPPPRHPTGYGPGGAAGRAMNYPYRVSGFGLSVKRLLVGRPFRSDSVGETLLPKRIALPVFASDALSSVAYAPDEILLTLSIAGMASFAFSPWIACAVIFVMGVVVWSNRKNVHAYPSGGGDYEVTTTNLGRRSGTTVASALLVDYVLTVAVSISSGAQYAAAAIPWFQGHESTLAIVLVLLLTAMNLRGIKESGSFFAIPVYLFMFGIGAMTVWGTFQHFSGTLGLAASAGYTIVPEPGYEQGLEGFAGAFLMLRAFSSGCSALTGVEAIGNGVPSFRPPKSRNAATTLMLLGLIASAMLVGILLLSSWTRIRFVEDPEYQLLDPSGAHVGTDYVQNPVIGQLAEAVFADAPFMFYALSIVTGLILILAANTAFNGFPVLASILARDGFLPRQMQSRGDRLAFSNGIIALAVAAIALIWIYDAKVTSLIQLYIVGVFVSFTHSQLGMVIHWTRLLQTVTNRRERGQIRRNRVVNCVGFGLTSLVLVIVLITKFTHGAWIACAAMAVLYVMMSGINRHYRKVAEELQLDEEFDTAAALPSRVHAVVLVSKIHKPTLRALAYARATRPTELEALTVRVEASETEKLMDEWRRLEVPVPLKVLDSPYREISRPVLTYVRSLRRSSPRDLVVVYVPEYVVGRWWEQILHNQSALRLKARLLFSPGIVVASVPWHLDSFRDAVTAAKAKGDLPRSLSQTGLFPAPDLGPRASSPSGSTIERAGTTPARPTEKNDRGTHSLS
ncbi:APC family permease [Micrococcales bacterium 31B]|nr:APC family permease [Micrococcales bacterium 31B]